MTYFEYAAIYFGIIVGLALTNILTSVHKLVEARTRVRWHWLAPVSAAYAATLTLGEFWRAWERQHLPIHRTLISWIPVALAFAVLFLMCAASLPDDAGEHGVDLNRYYIDNRRRFWGMSLALHALNLMSWTAQMAEWGWSAQAFHANLVPILGNAGEAFLSITLIVSAAKWWHALALGALWLYALSFFGPMVLS